MRAKLENFLRDISLNIRRERELDLNRRGFIASTLALIGVFFLSSTPFAAIAMRKRAEENQVDRYKIADLNELEIGKSKTFAYPNENDPAILVRLTEKDYRSYHIKCTHLQCPVYWDEPSGNLMCPCHNGFFAVEDGSVLAGPPQRPLPSIELAFENDGIYAVGMVNHQAANHGA